MKNDAGEVVELRCTYDPATRGGDSPDGRRPKATLHWLSAAHAVPAEVRLYDHLFTRPDPGADGDLFADLNPGSEEVLPEAFVEPSAAELPIGQTVQFERLGYFCADVDSRPGQMVFNRTLTLKDTWAKVQAAGKKGVGEPEGDDSAGCVPARPADLQELAAPTPGSVRGPLSAGSGLAERRPQRLDQATIRFSIRYQLSVASRNASA